MITYFVRGENVFCPLYFSTTSLSPKVGVSPPRCTLSILPKSAFSTADPYLADPIPSIEIALVSKSPKNITNCAGLAKGSNSYYNTNPENDNSCVDTNLTNPPPPVNTCEQFTTFDLNPASSWTDAAGDHPTENNVFATYPPHPAWANVIWDGAMNWFDFGSSSSAVHNLSIDFCACGDTSVTIDELKSDNYSKIYLDTDPTPSSFSNPAYIASRSNGNSQSTMASWGTSESGSLTVPFSGGTPTNHTLNFQVKNGSGPSGGAVNGSLAFWGRLGACDANTTLTTHYAYITDGSSMKIIDITDPTVPALEGNVTTNSSYKVFVSDGYAYVSEFVYADPYVDVVDISIPSAPSIATTVPKGTTFGRVSDMYIEGNISYVSDEYKGVHIVDIGGGAFSQHTINGADAMAVTKMDADLYLIHQGSQYGYRYMIPALPTH